MPTYEYKCSKCGHSFETIQSISQNALTICPKELCAKKPWGKGKVTRGVGGGSGLLFKGTGFYITDYRSDKYKAAAKSDVAPAAPAKTEKPSSTPPAAPAKPKA